MILIVICKRFSLYEVFIVILKQKLTVIKIIKWTGIFLFCCVKVFKSPVNAFVIGALDATSFNADKKIRRESIFTLMCVYSRLAVRQIN